tara:strand:- start:221 stop:604 length:384 start_codon:yes stop_codon:yes gene_type:complete
MDDRMEDRTEHLEKRIQINSNLISAFQFCQDNADCTADAESLSEMIGKLSSTVDRMQSKLDGSDSMVDKEDYEDGTQEECEEKGGTWTTDDRKGEYCAPLMSTRTGTRGRTGTRRRGWSSLRRSQSS